MTRVSNSREISSLSKEAAEPGTTGDLAIGSVASDNLRYSPPWRGVRPQGFLCLQEGAPRRPRA